MDKKSLRTRNRRKVERIRDARNQAAERPQLGIAMAKAYLTAHDPQIAEPTWQDVLNEFCTRGKPQKPEHRRWVAARKPLNLIRSQKVLETAAKDFLSVLEKGGVMNNTLLRCVHNLAVGLGRGSPPRPQTAPASPAAHLPS